MEIRCQECGHPNQLGAIFCRGCGEKLELENLKPEVKARSNKRIGITPYALRRLISLIVFIGILGILACLFIPTSYPAPEETDSVIVSHKHKVVFKTLLGQPRLPNEILPSIELSAAEIGAIFTLDLVLGQKKNEIDVDSGDQTLVARKIDFVTTGDNSFDLHGVFNLSVGISRDITNTLSVTFNNEEEDGVTFEITGGKWGKIPVGPVTDPVKSNMRTILEASLDLEKFLRNIESFEYDSDEKLYTLTFKESIISTDGKKATPDNKAEKATPDSKAEKATPDSKKEAADTTKEEKNDTPKK